MRTKLLITSGAWLALYAIGTVVAIARKLPYDHPLFGTGDPDRVVADWLGGSGTALSGPFFMFLVMAASVFLLTRSRPAFTVGVVTVTIIGLVGTFGVLGESITWDTVTGGGFDPIAAVVSWGMFLVGMLMWAFGVAELLRHRHETVEAPPLGDPHPTVAVK